MFFIVNITAADEVHQQHQAHVHGEAELLIALDRGVLEIAFRSPGANVVGFEHSPRNEQQRQAVAAATEILQRADQLFSIPAATPTSEYLARYLYHCEHPGRLDHLDMKLFNYFPATQVIEAQSVSERGQRKTGLTAEHTRVVL